MINSKTSVLTGVLYNIRNYLGNTSLRQIYFSPIYPHLTYCCAIWGGAYSTYIDSLYLAQKKLLRALIFKGGYDHTNPIFIDNRLLKLNDIINLYTNCFVHKTIYLYPLDPGCTIMQHGAARRTLHLRLLYAEHSTPNNAYWHVVLNPGTTYHKPLLLRLMAGPSKTN